MSTPINNWPDLSNSANNYLLVNQITREIEKTYGDFLSVNLSAGNVTLTDAGFRAAVVFRGTGHAVARDLTVPAIKKLFVVENTGAAILSVKRGSTTVAIATGSGVLLYTDGTTNGLASVAGGSGGSGGWDSLASPAIAAGVLTLDLAIPTGFKVTLDQNVTSILFTSAPSSKVITFSLELVQDGTGGRTVTWPGTVTADDGGSIPAPATAAGSSTIYTLQSTDGTNFKLFAGVENGFTVQSGAINEAPQVTLASAATVNIGAAAANTISISGTTGITSLGTSPAGWKRTLVFQGALTITHNATSLILPFSASNVLTVAGDVAEFVSLGSGNWRCTRYQQVNGALRGSNANGEYVRYPDGHQVCTSAGLSVADIAAALGPIFQSTAAITWTFPAAFATGVPPKVKGAMAATTLWPGIGAPTATAVAARGLAGVTTGTAQTVNLEAVGRWF